ncbi:MAG: hypothetical protein J1E83_01475 [Lachnospiraceae bacterium]|nr:hypothetical protein [Lachnospiraceae bacterium]
MKSSKEKKEKKIKMPMSLTKKVVLTVLGIAAAAAVAYLIYYLVHYMLYDKYKDYLSSYEYEAGTAFSPISESKADVTGMVLVSENEFLKLYTNTSNGYVAVYDKRTGDITYSNPLNADEDSIANATNVNFLKSQFILNYYNADVVSGTYDSYSQSVAKGQFSVEGIENGVRYVYEVGEKTSTGGGEGIWFKIPVEYRLSGDGLEVSVPVKGIEEYGNASVYRIQLLRYFGAADVNEEGYLVVPNGSGSLIRFNNGKTSAANYAQYVYDIDPLAANYTTTENVEGARLSLFGICREDRSLLVTIEEGASTAVITAGVSGAYNDYNYAYPTFVLRVADNLRMFGDATQDVYVLEPNAYDINLTVRYTFLDEEYKGYAGLANYYRNRLIAEGALTPSTQSGDIPFYYDIISGVKETSHFLGVQYLHTFTMTSFDEAGQISNDLAANGVTNQVMNLQGWFNGGYYHDAANRIRVPWKLGGRSGLKDLQETLTANGGTLYTDVAFQQVTYADDGFNYNAEGARYYGAGYVAGFGLINPTTLRNTSGLGHMESLYDVLSPKFLPRYVGAFAKRIVKYPMEGISLRDLGNYLPSDKKRTEMINREEALEIVLAQLDILEGTGKKMLMNQANDYAFAYSSDIINVPITDNDFAIVDENIPLYEMIIHGSINYSSKLLNFQDEEDMTGIVLNLIEAGASPHYVFTWEASSEMKDTGLNRYYATTYETWKGEALEIYNQVNDALKYVNGALVVNHEILDNGVRKVTYDNGVIIYINYSSQEQKADGASIPAMSYRLEGI